MGRPKGSKDSKPRKPRSRKQEDITPPRTTADDIVPLPNAIPFPTEARKKGRQYLPSESLDTPPALRNPHPIRPKAPPPPPGTKRPAHRPPIYTEELADYILDQMSIGHSVQDICRRDGMPNIDTVWRWRWTVPGFSERYAQARDRRAEIQALRVEELADEPPVTYVDDRGIERIDPAWAQVQKLRIDSRKWIASRLVPAFSERVAVAGKVDHDHKHSIDPNDRQRFHDVIAQARARRDAIPVEAHVVP